jgi:hypothetical protein
MCRRANTLEQRVDFVSRSDLDFEVIEFEPEPPPL